MALSGRSRAERGPGCEHRQVPEGAVRWPQPRDQRQGRLRQGGQSPRVEHRRRRAGRGALRRGSCVQAKDDQASKKRQNQPEEVNESPDTFQSLLIILLGFFFVIAFRKYYY